MIILLLCFLVSAVATVSSSLSVLEPLDDQLPLIARVDQPFSWALSPKTFITTNGVLRYTTSSLPGWLLFDPSTLAFHGTPSAKDEGNPEITVTAHDSTSSVSSEFTLCVTPYPAPTLNLPIPTQFHESNPSLSSVFLLAPNSAIATPNPALRAPPGWSFSIGFEGDTFMSANSIFYQARLANGSSLPKWMVFNPKSMTLNGVAPHEDDISCPAIISLNLIASDQEGYSAASLPFDLVIATHELSLSTSSLPTINVTTSTPFNISLTSPVDYSGVLVDGQSIQPSDIVALSIDTSAYGWLTYDSFSRTLSGKPSDDVHTSGPRPLLPVILSTAFNQSIRTNVSLAVVPSYFSVPNLPSLQVPKDGQVHFNLQQYFSNITMEEPRDDVSLTSTFDPTEAGDFLAFDPATAQLTGDIPGNFAATHIDITFTAYSHVTHSTSHAALAISVTPSDGKRKGFSRPSGLSTRAHAKLVLGLGITFGIIAGLCLFGCFLAAMRHCARVGDTALVGEEGRSAWTEKDKKWYGLGLEKLPGENQGRGYGWTERYISPPDRSRHAMDLAEDPFEPTDRARSGPDYGNLGLGLRRVSERSHSNPISHAISSPGNKPRSPGVMSKREFITRIRETVRRVSDKYGSGRRRSPTRPVIGKPILLRGRKTQSSHADAPGFGSSDPFDDPGPQSHPGSTILSNSPSTSTGERSIPRRRADFAPPRSPPQVHFEDGQLARQESISSSASDSSARNHAAEAVVHTASRATSVRSGRSTSGLSRLSDVPQVAGPRPRLVPFTSATRVPVPLLAPPPLAEGSSEDHHQLVTTTHRVASQSAKICDISVNEEQADVSNQIKSSRSGDELSMGLHYVRTLGADQYAVRNDPSTPTLSTNVRSSFSSLESSHQGHTVAGDAMRMLVRTGEKFRHRVPLDSASSYTSSRGARDLEMRLRSGGPLPRFLHVDMGGVRRKGAVELYGTPAVSDLGEFDVGVYTSSDGVCVARVVLEVIRRH